MKEVINFELKKVIILIVLFPMICFSVLAADLKLPAIINSNMVLQQKSKCKIWGWSGPGDTIAISIGWSGEVKFCVSDTSGRWKTSITTPAAGGPYKLVIEGDTVIKLRNILIGEVWVCGGQSNMQMPFNGYISMPVNGSNDYIAHGNNNNIRLFTVERKFSVTPMEN